MAEVLDEDVEKTEEKESKESKETKKDYSKFHTKPVAEWKTTLGGDEYIRYLKKAESTNKLNTLTSEEKEDLKRLKEYEKENQSEELQYDESAIDWERLQTPYDVAFYLSYPPFLLSSVNKNIQNYVISQYKTTSISEICKTAKERLGKTDDKKADKNKDEEKKEGSEENKETGKKKSLFIRLMNFSGRRNMEWIREHKDEGKDPYRAEALSEEEARRVHDEASALLVEEGLVDADGVELGDDK